jgi:hypothetical protein
MNYRGAKIRTPPFVAVGILGMVVWGMEDLELCVLWVLEKRIALANSAI